MYRYQFGVRGEGSAELEGLAPAAGQASGRGTRPLRGAGGACGGRHVAAADGDCMPTAVAVLSRPGQESPSLEIATSFFSKTFSLFRNPAEQTVV